jgi:hypothetical protein
VKQPVPRPWKWIALAALICTAGSVHADTFDPAFPNVSLNSGRGTAQLLPGVGGAISRTELIKGTDAFLLPFEVSGAGTVTVTLTDLGWPSSLSTLSFAALSSTTLLAQLTAPGSLTFQLTGAGRYFAAVYGIADPTFGVGLYSLNLSYAPVPLPAAPLLLVSGFALFALARKKIVINDR